MIKGLLLYTETDAQKNRWFTGHLTEAAKNHGMELRLSIFDGNFSEYQRSARRFDFCINRTRESRLNDIFEAQGIRCYNNGRTVKTANDKWLTCLLCRDTGVPTADTLPLDRASPAGLPYPFIVKSRNGHGGSEVFWISGERELQSLPLTNKSGYIIQRPVSGLSADVRVYTLGGRAVAAVKRTSQSDFRSNFSLGGKAELFTPTDEQLSAIAKLQSVISSDYAGFDFILDNGQWLLNEIEDAVGARMLYSLCDYDIGKEFISYIRRDISGTD